MLPSRSQDGFSPRSTRASDLMSRSVSIASISSADLKIGRHVRISGEIKTTGRTKTVKDSVMGLQTLQDLEEPEDSMTFLPNSFWELMIYRWKTMVGAGVLAMPYAFSHSGWLMGIVLTIFINFSFRYCFQACLNIVDEMNNIVPENGSLRFPEAMRIAFKSGPAYIKWLHRPWKYIWMTLYSVLMVGACGVYILFIAINFAQIFQDIDILWSIRIWIACVFAAIALVLAIPELHLIVPFTSVASFIQLMGIVLIMYFLFTNLPPLAERDMTRPITEYAIFLGISCFAAGFTSFISLLNTKSSFTSKSVTIASICSALLYTLIGFFGYWKYGSGTLPSVSWNLPTMWEFPQWIRLLFIVGVFFICINHMQTFMHPIWHENIKPKLRMSPKWKLCLKYLLRFIILLFAITIAMAIPRSGFLMCILALFSNFLLAFVFVPLAELSVFWPNKLGPFYWIAVRNIVVVSLGIILVIPAFLTILYFLFSSFYYGEEYDFLPCTPNNSSGTLKLYCN